MEPDETADPTTGLGRPLELRSGVRLKNRLAKAAMSDSLGDGAGASTDEQIELYRRWCDGGAALSIIGEVQIDPRFPEKPGNLVLDGSVDDSGLRRMAEIADRTQAHIWPQLGHAGALADPALSAPLGPSALDIDGLVCGEMPIDEVEALPQRFATAAGNAVRAGLTGVEIHAAHGFLLSQFLSPLFNHRTDQYGGSIEARAKLLLDVVDRVRRDAGPGLAIGVKLNATDELHGGLSEGEALVVVEMLDRGGVDLIDISGGTYFPGAQSSSERPSEGPYYADFAARARPVTSAALMLTGGVKTRQDALHLLDSGVDLVGLARTMALKPDLPNAWLKGEGDPTFPRFTATPPGGVTAWYTMRLAAIAGGEEPGFEATPHAALAEYDARDANRVDVWNGRFGAAS